jgi:hypothetical protein
MRATPARLVRPESLHYDSWAVSGALRVVVRGAQLVAAEGALSPAWVTNEGHSPMLVDRRADKGSHLGKRCPMVVTDKRVIASGTLSHGLAGLG